MKNIVISIRNAQKGRFWGNSSRKTIGRPLLGLSRQISLPNTRNRNDIHTMKSLNMFML